MKKLTICATVAVAVALIVGCDNTSKTPTAPQSKLSCEEDFKRYEAEMVKKNFSTAKSIIAFCKTKYPEKYEIYSNNAELKEAIAAVHDTSKSASVRLDLFLWIKRTNPNAITELTTTEEKLRKEFLRENEANEARRKKQEVAEAKRKKSEGVSIGMTQAEVVASSWGRPTRINRTTNQYGVREQWVYGEYGRNYLYFKDGILTSIQN